VAARPQLDPHALGPWGGAERLEAVERDAQMLARLEPGGAPPLPQT
jgi:hypothetical protein